MAFTDSVQKYTTLDNAIGRVYDYRRTKPQYQRAGQSANWFRPAGFLWKGKSYQYNALVAPASAIRRAQLSVAKDQEWPVGRDMKTQPLCIKYEDIVIFRGTAKINEFDDLKTQGDPDITIGKLAERIVGQLMEDFDTQRDMALFQPGTCEMFTIKQIYNVDGTTFTGAAAAAAAYIAVTGGSIAQVQPGDVLEIIDVADHSTVNATVTVNAVIKGKNGPMVSTGIRVADIGPGIIATPAAAWNAVGAPAATDHIARSGEFNNTAATYKNIKGFESFFNPTISIFRSEDGTAMDRYDATGDNQWQVPEVFCFDSVGDGSGTAVDFDVDTHFGEVEDVMGYVLSTSRMQRVSANQDTGPNISLPEVITMHTTPQLVNDVVSQCKDTARLTTSLAMSQDEATRRKFFGEIGFDGFVYHSPTLGHVALMPSVACRPNRMFFVDPQTAFWIHLGGSGADGSGGGLQWLDMEGSRWQRLTGDTLRTPTAVKQAACYTASVLGWDQVAQNFAIKGIKSSRD
jgi:hypothetical protein